MKNWYKTSQLNEDYYTKEIAKDPNTSHEILKKILEQGKDDWTSMYAVDNPNCPVYLLEDILKRGKNDGVSQYAAENPNCPASALEMVLGRGNNDVVSRYASSNPNCPGSALEMVLKRGNDDYVSYCAATNPNCPALAKIEWMKLTGKIGKEDPTKHIIEREEIKEDEDLKKLRALISKSNSWYKKAQNYNYDIIKALKDPNTSPEILREIILEAWKNGRSFILDVALKNPNCPPDVLKTILESEDNWIAELAVSNPNCPSDSLEILLKRQLNSPTAIWVSLYAVQNPNCPQEMLVKILKRGKDDLLSEYATQNPNCPPKLKIEWMRSVGKIEQFDPSKHIMESDEKKYEEDPDLQKLRDLISKNKNWYKTSRINENYYYTLEIADDTRTSPEILKKILEKGNNDFISRNAAHNKNCPASALEMVLKRGYDDAISWNAARNPNCPPEALAEVLKRGKDDWVSHNAVMNPNCPPEALAEVLKRGNNDGVSYDATMNPNCPLKSKIEWMMATGKIEKEDPSKHIIEREEIKEDEDLKKLRDLIAKSNSWYKTALESPELKKLCDDMEEQYRGLSLFAFEDNNKVYINEIRLPKEMQNQGIGSLVIRKIQEYAQKVGKPVVLHPQPDPRKKKKLYDFYKDLDFVHNKGRNRDYRISEPFANTMYWRPKS